MSSYLAANGLFDLAAALRADPAVWGEVPDRLGRRTPPAAVEALPGARGESRVTGEHPVAGDPGGIGQRRGCNNERTQR